MIVVGTSSTQMTAMMKQAKVTFYCHATHNVYTPPPRFCGLKETIYGHNRYAHYLERQLRLCRGSSSNSRI